MKGDNKLKSGENCVGMSLHKNKRRQDCDEAEFGGSYTRYEYARS